MAVLQVKIVRRGRRSERTCSFLHRYYTNLREPHGGSQGLGSPRLHSRLHPPEERLPEEQLTAQRQLRQLVVLILCEIALVSTSLQLSKPV
jgi:hypothetical protein